MRTYLFMSLRARSRLINAHYGILLQPHYPQIIDILRNGLHQSNNGPILSLSNAKLLALKQRLIAFKQPDAIFFSFPKLG